MSFDRLAPYYRWMEGVLMGTSMQRTRIAWLDRVRDAGEVLITGEGPGRFLCAAAPRMGDAKFTVVDASARMISLARAHWEQIGSPGTVEFIHATLPGWQLDPGRYDLIVTPFFLDCFARAELAEVITALAAGATARCAWLLADFAIPPRGPTRWRAAILLACAYAFFHHATRISARHLVEPDPMLSSAGFQLEERALFDWGLLHSDLWRRVPSR